LSLNSDYHISYICFSLIFLAVAHVVLTAFMVLFNQCFLELLQTNAEAILLHLLVRLLYHWSDRQTC